MNRTWAEYWSYGGMESWSRFASVHSFMTVAVAEEVATSFCFESRARASRWSTSLLLETTLAVTVSRSPRATERMKCVLRVNVRQGCCAAR